MKDLKSIQELVFDFAKKLGEESTETLNKAESEMKSLLGYLVEKGKITQSDGKKILDELSEKARKSREDFEKRLDERTQWLMGYLNIPTKSEVDQLSARVDSLSRKVRTLKKQLDA
jgi:polyhydroxyalkanoate synthesis regulator phasin